MPGPGQPAESVTGHVHATVVIIGEKGVAILGPSGAGKSALAEKLIAEARARGRFARLVGDDRIRFSPHGDRVVAIPHPLLQGRIERRGIGIAEVDWLEGAVIALAITIAPSPERMPAPASGMIDLAGIAVPRIVLDSRGDLANRAHLVLDMLRA
jgi:serine kinase of HPr protein (carbohydrate metabolism regulator)